LILDNDDDNDCLI